MPVVQEGIPSLVQWDAAQYLGAAPEDDWGCRVHNRPHHIGAVRYDTGQTVAVMVDEEKGPPLSSTASQDCRDSLCVSLIASNPLLTSAGSLVCTVAGYGKGTKTILRPTTEPALRGEHASAEIIPESQTVSLRMGGDSACLPELYASVGIEQGQRLDGARRLITRCYFVVNGKQQGDEQQGSLRFNLTPQGDLAGCQLLLSGQSMLRFLGLVCTTPHFDTEVVTTLRQQQLVLDALAGRLFGASKWPGIDVAQTGQTMHARLGVPNPDVAALIVPRG